MVTGDRPYEFAAAGLWIARGDPRLLGRLLAAYAHSFGPRELLAYTLLHVHSNLPGCIEGSPGPARADPGLPGSDLVLVPPSTTPIHPTGPYAPETGSRDAA